MALVKQLKDQEVIFQSIEDLFNQHNFSIPNFQRRYNWKTTNISELLDSVFELSDEIQENQYSLMDNYIGSILLNDGHNQSTLDVIDGQQRLISIALILIAIRDNLIKTQSNLKSKNMLPSEDLEEDLADTLNKLSSMLGEKERIYRRKINKSVSLITSYDPRDNEILDKIYRRDEYPNNRTISKNFQYIGSSLLNKFNERSNHQEFNNNEYLDYLLLIYECVASRTFVLKNKLIDVADSFAMFESVNTTGMQLTPFDLINGHITTKLKEQSEVHSNEWILKITGYLDDGTRLNDYIFNWVNSGRDTVSNRDLYKHVKDLLTDPQYNGDIIKLSDDLLKAFASLDDYLKGDSTSARFINILKRKRLIPFYLTLSRLRYPEKEIEEFMIELIKYSIMELNIKQKSPGTFQYKLKKLMHVLLDGDEKANFYQLISNSPKLNVIEQDLTSYSKESLGVIIDGTANNDDLYKVLLILIVSSENPSFNLKHGEIQLEHTLPKRPSDDWGNLPIWEKIMKDDETVNRLRGSLGNLTLLNEKLNNVASNSVPSKKQIYINEDLQVFQYDSLKNSRWNLIDYENFSPMYIDERTKELVDYICVNNILFHNRD